MDYITPLMFRMIPSSSTRNQVTLAVAWECPQRERWSNQVIIVAPSSQISLTRMSKTRRSTPSTRSFCFGKREPVRLGSGQIFSSSTQLLPRSDQLLTLILILSTTSTASLWVTPWYWGSCRSTLTQTQVSCRLTNLWSYSIFRSVSWSSCGILNNKRSASTENLIGISTSFSRSCLPISHRYSSSSSSRRQGCINLWDHSLCSSMSLPFSWVSTEVTNLLNKSMEWWWFRFSPISSGSIR